MKQSFSSGKKGFTLVELLVVMAIMAILMCMAGNVLRNSGSGRGIESGLSILESVVEEARATAMGNDTHTRIMFISDPDDQSADSKHLRYIVVQKFERKDNKTYDGSSVTRNGDWKKTSDAMLPPGVFFSPEFSVAKDPAPRKGRKGGSVDTNLIARGNFRLPSRGQVETYYVEFDEKGRLVGPDTTVDNRPGALLLVLISGRLGDKRDSRATYAVVPSSVDSKKHPIGAKGIQIAPHGEVSILRTEEQVYGK